ncbi:MAG: saccharopine dehydrogenase NADP-binding domain-containing protein, partial [Candidatus Poseidoniia archaeon]|nr:saccharopine dehydrogenase NADP-binding domain-containing protein [Candidatus Poseidoniia archaeon]
MNIAVIGTGMVGRLIAVELSKKYQVYAIDNNTTNLNILKKLNSNIITKKMDVENEDFLESLEDTEIIVNCVPGFMGFETSKKILEKKTCVDISFMPEDCNELKNITDEAKTALYPDAGV